MTSSSADVPGLANCSHAIVFNFNPLEWGYVYGAKKIKSSAASDDINLFVPLRVI